MAKQSTKQKFLSVLLAVSMMAGMFPAGAIAEGELLPASAAAAAEEASADSETVQAAAPDIQPEAGTPAPASESAGANEDEAAATGDPDAQTPAAYAAADTAAEEQAYFIDKVKLVPIDIQPELKVPEDYTQVWEPEVQWDLTSTDISRDANVYLWFKYVMPDADYTPKKGVPYTAIVKAPLTCAEPQHTVITCGQDEVAKVEVAKTETPGELKMTIWFEETADDKYFAPGVPGYFWVATQFDASLIDNDGKQQIEVSVDGAAKDTPTIGFAFTEPTFSAKVEKKHAEQADAEDGKQEITWTSTVTIESHDLPSSDHTAAVTLDDTMKNQKYVKSSAEVIAVDGAESSAVAITESDPAFDETENGDHVSFTLQNVPLSNEPHTVTIRYKTTYADMEYLPIQIDSKTVAAKVEFRNTVKGTVTVPSYEKNTDGEVVSNGEQTVDAGESGDATYLTVAQLTKTVSTTDLSGANITTTDGMLLWQIFVDSDLANQEIIDTIGNGHELVLDAQHPLTIGDYTKDKDGNYAYVGTPVTCTSFLEEGSKEAGIFEGKAVGSSKQYVISLGEKTGKTMITYYTQINGTTQDLVNKAEFRAEGFDDGTTLPYQKTFNMRSTFLAKESNRDTGYDPKTQKITWKVTVNGGGYLPGGITLVDEFCKSIGVANPKKYDQKLVHEEADPFTLTVTRNKQATEYVLDNRTLTADGVYSIVNKNDPTDILGTIGIAGDSYEDTGFTLALTNLQAGYDSVVLNYKTQLLASDREDVATDLKSWINNKANTVQVCNKITLQQGNGRPNITSACWVYANTPVLKKEPTLLDANGFAAAGDAAGNRNYNYETGEAAWKIAVNEAQMAFDSDIVLYDVLDYGSDAAWSYVEDSVKVTLAGREITNFTTQFDKTADGKPTMTVTLPAVASGQGAYVVTYKTKVDKRPTADRPGLDSNEVQTLKNTVTLTGGPIVSGVTADSSVKITAGKISKSGSKDADFGRNHLVTWEIVVNKNLADLSQADSDKIVIRDDLELGLQYMEDPTVQKFTKNKAAADGTIVPDGLEDANLSGEWADYDPETRRLTFTFTKEDLRETGYVIRYQTRVMDGQKHSNSASYSVTGTTSEKDSAGDTVNSYYGNGFTVIPGTGTVLIRKQKSDGTALAGATFTVSQEINGSWVAIGKLTTENGYATIQDAGTFEENAAMAGLKYGHYKVEETAAPDGYVNGRFTQEFTLSSEHAAQEITCTNYRTDEGGWLELTKTISGPIAADKIMPTVQFTVTGPDGEQVGVYTLDQFVKGEDGIYTLKIDKILPPGSYTVTETITQDVEGCTLAQVSTKVQVGDGEPALTETDRAVRGDEIKVTAEVESGKTTTVAYTNRYSENSKPTPPSESPSPVPSPSPMPSATPSESPSPVPSTSPSESPLPVLSPTPSESPSPVPSTSPSESPSPVPSTSPSESPSPVPSPTPSESPLPVPSPTPSESPSPVPSATPSASPSPVPSTTPSESPLPVPSPTPSESPSPMPSPTPSVSPSPAPSTPPSAAPSPVPSATPSATPSPVPSATPSMTPAPASTQQPSTTQQPTAVPQPEKTPQPSSAPQVSIPQTGDYFPAAADDPGNGRKRPGAGSPGCCQTTQKA